MCLIEISLTGLDLGGQSTKKFGLPQNSVETGFIEKKIAQHLSIVYTTINSVPNSNQSTIET